MLRPYDLHVLATPPAFRLSQDQTLQLNFLARAHPDAPCGPCGLMRTDTFSARVYPRNEFVRTAQLKTFACAAVTALASARRRRSVPRPPAPCGSGLRENSARLKHLILAPPAREDRGVLTQKTLIKEDHFLACTTRICLSRGDAANRAAGIQRPDRHGTP